MYLSYNSEALRLFNGVVNEALHRGLGGVVGERECVEAGVGDW